MDATETLGRGGSHSESSGRVASRPVELPAGRKREGRAFTLLELLVVITVIAVLISILAPSLGTARDRARLTICLANQKAIINGLALYRARHGNMFPYNYADYGAYKNAQRWALDEISEFVNGVGGPEGQLHGKNRDEGQFPNAYICPSADLNAVYGTNPSDNYHACYWTNIAVRLNRGWGDLFSRKDDLGPNQADVEGSGGSYGKARFSCVCPKGSHWRSVYHPTMDSVRAPEGMVFAGDTNDTAWSNTWYSSEPGAWQLWPGHGRVQGSLGMDRHAGKITLTYVDGRASIFTWERMWDYYMHPSYVPAMTMGSWMVKYTGTDSCTGDRVHILHERIVE